MGPRKALVVLGMHRSGTSAFARCCNLLGAELGARLLPAEDSNETGYWEDAGIVAANEAILETLGLRWDDVRPMPDAWPSLPVVEPGRRRLRAIVADELAAHPLWLVKDPRLCRLVPLWRTVFADLDCEPHFLVSLRHPDDVAASLARRDRFSQATSRLLWLRHVLEAEHDTRGARRLFVRYDDLLADPGAVLRNAGEALGLAWPIPLADAGPEIDRFVDPRLRHHATGCPEGAGGRELPALVSEVHRTLERAARDPAFDPSPVLDEARAALAAGDAALAPLLSAMQDEIRTLKVQARQDRERLAVASRALDAHRDYVARLEADVRSYAAQLNAQARAAEELAHVRSSLEAALGARPAQAIAPARRAVAHLRVATRAMRARWPWVQWLAGLIAYRPHRVELVPASDLEVDGAGYRSTGPDPQFLLRVERPEIPHGWVVLSFVARRRGMALHPRLYVDDGGGFSEPTAVDLGEHVSGPFEKLIRFPDRVHGLRLDPADGVGGFTLECVRITELGTLPLTARLARTWLRTRLRGERRRADERRAPSTLRPPVAGPGGVR